jgi:hypothetical protein
MCFFGTRICDWLRKPVRMLNRCLCSSQAYSCVPQSPQNAWTRRLPLSATLMYSLGVPVMPKSAASLTATALYGPPPIFWQSEQWQAITVSGSTWAVTSMEPQWQRPSTLIFSAMAGSFSK